MNFAAQRCVRHGEREAAARCQSCGRYFCRECATVHEGVILCSDCLARSIAASAVDRPRRGASLRSAAALAGGAIALWVAFFLLGRLLEQIPQPFHEGTLWQEKVGDS